MNERVISIPVLTFGSCNAYLVQGKKTILVDTGIPGSARKILSKMREHDVRPQDVSLILLTHVDGDHTGSVAELKKVLDAPVALHAADTPYVGKEHELSKHVMGLFGHLLKRTGQTSTPIPGYMPDLVWEEELCLEPYGISGSVFATPGHTPGHASVHLTSGDILAGDAISGHPVFQCVPSHPPFVHDIAQALNSVRCILEREPRLIYTGHGGPLEPAKVCNWLEGHARTRREGV